MYCVKVKNSTDAGALSLLHHPRVGGNMKKTEWKWKRMLFMMLAIITMIGFVSDNPTQAVANATDTVTILAKNAVTLEVVTVAIAEIDTKNSPVSYNMDIMANEFINVTHIAPRINNYTRVSIETLQERLLSPPTANAIYIHDTAKADLITYVADNPKQWSGPLLA